MGSNRSLYVKILADNSIHLEVTADKDSVLFSYIEALRFYKSGQLEICSAKICSNLKELA